MRTITLEEHYATEAFMEGPGRELKAQAEAARSHPQVAAGYKKLIEQLCDLGDGRISAMDAAGIGVQVLSLTFPGVEQLETAEAVAFAHQTNDLLGEAVRRLVKDERAWDDGDLLQTRPARAALRRQEALEEEAVGRQARDDERRQHGGRSGNRGDRQPLADRGLDELVAGI